MKKALIFTTSMGHKSIASACSQMLKQNNWQTKIFFSTFAETSFHYYPIYKFFPALNKPYFEITKNHDLPDLFEKIFSKRKIKKIKKIINEYQPNLIISTYFLYNPAISQIKKNANFSFINIVSNPRTFHPSELSFSAEKNLVYDQIAVKNSQKDGLVKKNIDSIGWLVRKRFYQKHEKKLKKLTILVSAGSLGTYNVIRFLPVFFQIKQPINLLLVAGKNKVLFSIFKNFKRLCRLFGQQIKIEAYSFTKKMPDLIAKADLVAGKAGPNLIFESVAAGKPFIALSYIPGQEDGNLEIIKQKSLGWVTIEPAAFRKLINQLVKNQGLILEKTKTVLKEKQKNQKANTKLIKIVNQLNC